MTDERDSEPKPSTRFQPGISGNRAGRPKGSKSRTTHKSYLNEQITVTESGGRKRRISRERVLLQTLFKAALKDSIAASKLLLRREKVDTKAAVNAALAEREAQRARQVEDGAAALRSKIEALATRISQRRESE